MLSVLGHQIIKEVTVFLNLETGRKIHGFKFTELAMPPHVIDRVHELADAKGSQTLDHDGCPIFEWEFDDPVEYEKDLSNEVCFVNPVEIDNSQSVVQNDIKDRFDVKVR